MILTATILVGGFFIFWGQAKATLDDVILNEVFADGVDEWAEILNPSASAININGYKIIEGTGPTATMRTINHDIFVPAQGIAVVSKSDVVGGVLTFNDTGDTVSLAKADGTTIIGSVTYGAGTDLDADGPDKSLQFINSVWTVQTPTKGWFNGDPTVSSIVAGINSADVTTNWGTAAIPDSSAAAGLYFEKTDYGRVTFNATLNLTDSDTVAFLQDLGNKMDVSAGSMKFDARTAVQLKNAGAEIQMYGLDALGFTSTPNLIVKDDEGTIIPPDDLNYPSLDGISYAAGTLIFTTSHFTRFEVDNSVYVSPSGNDETGNGSQVNPFLTIQKGIEVAPAGGTVNVAAGTYVEVGQIVINKDISIVGEDKATTIIKPAQNTSNTSHADTSAWILVNNDKTFNLSNTTLNGDGQLIAVGIFSHGHGIIDSNIFTNISYNQSGPDYKGIAVELYGSDMTVSNNTFSNIGRIGVFNGFGANSTISGNTYTGKGSGTWLDYGFEVGRNGQAAIMDNTISNNLGIASDGSTSAGILVTSYFNPETPSQATITSNTITDCTDGIAVGYDDTDGSIVVVNQNILTGNVKGINSTHPAVDAENNWWGTVNKATISGLVYGDVDFEPYYLDKNGTNSSSETLAEVYVDSAYSEGNAGSHTFSYDAFATISDAIVAVDAGGTVNVAAGTYEIDSSINVYKSVTITADTSADIVSIAQNTPVFKITADNVTIENFNITTNLSPFSIIGDEVNSALVLINAQNATISNNTIYADESSLGGMATWTARGITLQTGSATINGNTIYGVRNGIIGRYGVAADIENNTIFNTKGGIMNYTTTQADADNRSMANNSWTSTVEGAISHNEWDIVWNSGGGPYEPDYNQSVLVLSGDNNDAYVVSLMTTTGNSTTLTGNRSHAFVDATTGTLTEKWSSGNINLPYSTLALGIDAVVPGGTVNVAAGTYEENIIIDKSLTLQGEGSSSTIISPSSGMAVRITADNVKLNDFSITRTSSPTQLTDLGILLDSADYCEITNSKIYGNSVGVELLDAGNNIISSSTIDSNMVGIYFEGTTDGINIESGQPYYSLSINNQITNNTISNSVKADDNSGFGIYFDAECNNNNIEDNNIINNENGGVYLWKVKNNSIKNNLISGNASYGIHFFGSDDNIILDNNIDNNDSALIFRASGWPQGLYTVENNTINGNTIMNGVSAEEGISINVANNYWNSEDPDFTALVSGAVDYSPWWVDSEGTVSAIPAKPTLISLTTPTKDNTPTLSWNAVSAKPDVQNYSVKISIGEIDIENTTDSTTFTPTDALADGNYTWQVKATNSMGDSEFSNVGSFAIDTTSLAPASLTAGSETTNSLALSWMNSETNGSYYIIKRSTSEITVENFDDATTLGGAPTVAIGNQGYVAKNLSSDTTYYFAIKLVDTLGNASAIATASGKTSTLATVPTDNTAPSAIADLLVSAGSPATSQMTLTWTATGDDGDSGIASKYIIKRSTSAITDDAKFNAATTIFNTLSPKSVNLAETFTVTGLSANTTYYFAIKVQDEVPNTSVISNVSNLATLANLPTVSAITPAEGENGGAVLITVTGTNFADGANTLRFSNSSNTFELVATYVSATSLTAFVPVGAPVGVYSLKVSNSNGVSSALASAYTVKVAPTPLPTVSDVLPANIGSNDPDVSITIYGANFTGATAVIDTAPETALTITSVSSTKIIATIPGMVVAGTYNIKVTTVGGTNTISSIKLNVKDPVVIDSGTLEQTTTDPIDLSGTNTIPVQITMQSDETIVNTDTVATIEVVIPPATEVTMIDNSGNEVPYTGNINPPQIIKTTDDMKEEAGEEAIVITMGNPDEKITFSNDFVVTVTLDSTNTSAPLIWYYNPSVGLEIAGKDGVKDGITYVKGGTVLNTVNNNGVYTYTIGLLLDHMSSYVAGVDPSITSLSSSSATAGTAITITGTNFSPSANVKFGTTSATVSSLTTTSISIAVPSISVGSYNIIVTNTDGLFSNTKAFSVTATPSGGGGGGGFPSWFVQQPQSATPATPATPKVSPAVPATPATPAVPGKPAPKVLGEKSYANGTLVRGNDKKIFVIIDGQKKYIANLKELAKYVGQKIYDVKNTVLIQFPEVLGTKVLTDGSLMRGSDGKIYAIKNGKKQYIRSLEELRKGYFGKKIYDVNNETLAKY